MMDGLDSDVVRTWQLIGELTDQLNSNKALVVALQKQADELRERAATEHGQHSAKLRRFDVEIAKETFESEAERSHAAIVLENHSLLYENNQLSSLLREYEEALETIMNKFKLHAQSSTQHQLNMRQHYEHLIGAVSSGSLSPEEEESRKIFHQSAARLQLLLKHTIKALTEPPHPPPSHPPPTEPKPEASTSGFNPNNHLSSHAGSGSGSGGSHLGNRPSSVVPAAPSDFHDSGSHPHEIGAGPSGISPIDDLSIEALLTRALTEDGHGPPVSDDQPVECNWDWATTREHEIARLEAENAILRQHLLITPGSLAEYASSLGTAPPPDTTNAEDETQSIGPGLSIRAKVDGENRMKLRQSAGGKSLASPSPSGGSGSGFGGLGLGGMMGGGPGGRLREYSPPTGIGGGPGERGGGGGMGNAGAFGPLRAPPNRRPPPFPGSFGGSGSPISPVGMGPGGSDRDDMNGVDIEEGEGPGGGGGGDGRPGSPIGLYRNIALPSEADEADEGDVEGEGIEGDIVEAEVDGERDGRDGEQEGDNEEEVP